MTSPLVKFDHATLGYGRRVVLSDLSFDIPPGDFLGLVGPNGAGKTTILRAILGYKRTDDTDQLRVGRQSQFAQKLFARQIARSRSRHSCRNHRKSICRQSARYAPIANISATGH